MLLIAGLIAMAVSLKTQAASLPSLGLFDPNNLGNAIPQNVADEAIRMVSSYTAHRPHSGAAALGRTNSFDAGIETSLIKIGDGITDALNANSIPLSTSTLPAIPILKLQLRKSLGEKSDIGLSGLSYQGQSIYGGDLKWVVHDPEEGPKFALRFSFNKVKLPLAYVDICYTYGIEVVASQPLDFAESYIGLGGRYATGTMKTEITITGPPSVSTTLSRDGSATSAHAFTGVNFRIPGPQGLRIGFEGGYDFSGYHSLGTLIGVGF